MEEKWKEIDGFPDYFVSNFGRIKSCKRSKDGKIIKPVLKKGYCHVAIYDKNNKRRCVQVHRIVLKTFNPRNDMDELEVNHKDEVKTNNILSNLEWMTHLENVNYGTGHQRCIEQQKIKVRCVDTGETYNSMREASDTLGINYGNLSSCCSGRLKSVGGLHFEIV